MTLPWTDIVKGNVQIVGKWHDIIQLELLSHFIKLSGLKKSKKLTEHDIFSNTTLTCCD